MANGKWRRGGRRGLAAGDDADDFEAVAGGKGAGGEFGGGDGLAVVFDDDAAGEEFLGNEESFEGAGENGFDGFSVGNKLVVFRSHI
jgi:hypothetical protein